MEERAVAGKPCRVVRVGNEIFRVKHVDEVGTAHGASGVTGFRFLDHRSAEHADIVGYSLKSFLIGIHCQWCIMLYKYLIRERCEWFHITNVRKFFNKEVI